MGGLLVLLRAIGLTWHEIEREFSARLPEIFEKPGLLWRLNPTRPKYSDKGIVKAATELFGDRTCGDALLPFFVTSFNMETGKAKVFDRADPDLLRDVALRTSAAPTYFPPRGAYVDGAFVANNPSAIALAGARGKLGALPGDLRLLSFDTGGGFWKNPKVGPRTTVLGWAKPAIQALMHGGEEVHEYITEQALKENHLRISPNNSKDFEMDDLSRLGEWVGLWATAFHDSKERVAELFKEAPNG